MWVQISAHLSWSNHFTFPEFSFFICQVMKTSVPTYRGDCEPLHSQRIGWSWVLRQFSFQQSLCLFNSESEIEVNMLTEQITKACCLLAEELRSLQRLSAGVGPHGQRDWRLSKICSSWLWPDELASPALTSCDILSGFPLAFVPISQDTKHA